MWFLPGEIEHEIMVMKVKAMRVPLWLLLAVAILKNFITTDFLHSSDCDVMLTFFNDVTPLHTPRQSLSLTHQSNTHSQKSFLSAVFQWLIIFQTKAHEYRIDIKVILRRVWKLKYRVCVAWSLTCHSLAASNSVWKWQPARSVSYCNMVLTASPPYQKMESNG